MDSSDYVNDDGGLDGILALTPEQRIERAVQKLPTLSARDVPREDSCPICLVQFSSILSGEIPPPQSKELVGVTKLVGCGHVFCRLDLIEWIRGRHGTCPTCRHTFLDVKPISESDNESSDDDYIPHDEEFEDEDEEEDDFEFTDDDGDDESDFSLELDPRGLDEFVDAQEEITGEDEADEDSMRNWGLSDGDSLSDGEFSFGVDEGAEGETDDIIVQDDESTAGSLEEDGPK